MAITRMVGKPRQGAWLTDRLELWVDDDVPWPEVWTYFDLAAGGTHRMYYNAEHPVYQPFALYNEYSQSGGLEIAGTIISPNGAVVARDAKIGGLWSSRAGVFNRYVEEGGICPVTHELCSRPGPAVDVSVYSKGYVTPLGTSVKWLALYALLARASTLSDELPVQRTVEYNRQGGPEITYDVVEEFDWTFETA